MGKQWNRRRPQRSKRLRWKGRKRPRRPIEITPSEVVELDRYRRQQRRSGERPQPPVPPVPPGPAAPMARAA